MIPSTLYEEALRSSSPSTALRDVVVALSTQGYAKADLYASLERFLLESRTRRASQSDEEAILDVMDALSGWCHPSGQLLPDDDSLAAQEQ